MRERVRYMRDRGGANLQFTYGQDNFHGPTIRERQDKIIADAAAEGRSVRLKHPTYDRGGNS